MPCSRPLLALAWTLLAAPVCAGSAAPALFLPRAASPGFADAAPQRIGVVRERLVEIDPVAVKVLAAPLAPAGVLLDLNLFEDVTLHARIARAQAIAHGFSWAGRLEGEPLSDVLLTSYDGVVTGSVVWPGGAYRVSYDRRGAFVEQIDHSRFPEGNCFIELPRGDAAAGTAAGSQQTAAPAADDGSVIEVLVVYTPAARDVAGGTSGIDSLINTAVAETNQGYANSNVVQRLHLAATAEVSYTESDIYTDLDRVAAHGDGFMDAVQELRDRYGADVVSLIGAGYSAQGACGVAYLMSGNSAGFAPNAYSVVDVGCATGYYSFGHELGHNMGLNHARSDPTGAGAFDYSFGYKDPGAAFRTVMAYACSNGGFCPRILYFSNPTVSYDGKTTGIVDTAADSAYNARSLDETRVTVAHWRDGPCSYSLDPPGTHASRDAGTGSVAVTTSSPNCSWTVNSLDPALTITSARLGEGDGIVTYSYTANAGGPRTLRLTIAGQSFWVDQEPAACTYALDSSSAVLPASGGEGTVYLSTDWWCTWQVTGPDNSWVTWRLLLRAIGSGGVVYTVVPNPAGARTAVLTIAGQTFTVTQNPAACDSVSVTPASISPPVTGGAGTIAVGAQGWCAWSAISAAPWLRITSGANGSGPGSVGYQITANTSAEARTGTLTIAGQPVAVTQPGQPPGPWHTWFAVDPLETPMVGDFNGDGLTDIVTFTRQNPRALGDVYVALSNGTHFVDSNGVPDSSDKWNDWFAISTDETVLIGDFDGDGKDDLATWLGARTRQVYVALSTGAGMTPAQVWIDAIGLDATDVLASGDVNGDGKKDLVLFARTRGEVYVALSTGSAFAPAQRWHGFFAVSTYERPRVADVNGDGKADIVTFATDSPTAYGDVYVALSDGTRFVDQDGVPGSSTKWHDWFSIDPAQTIRIGDEDGDGKDDFFTFLPPPFAQCYTVRSEGTAMGENVLWHEAVAPSATDVPFVGDVNGDGKADVIVFAQGEGKVYVSLAP